jgi:hypothetical protein
MKALGVALSCLYGSKHWSGYGPSFTIFLVPWWVGRLLSCFFWVFIPRKCLDSSKATRSVLFFVLRLTYELKGGGSIRPPFCLD